MIDKSNKKYYIFIFILLLCEIFFFRNILFNDSLIGDRGDGRLTMLITEHWYRFCCGFEKINDLSIFYPAENTLAYSDMFLGYGIIHSIFRFRGLDMFLSYKITLILIHLLGVFSLFYFLSKVLKIDYFWSFFGTSAFSFSCTYANHFGHTQLNAISFIPLFLIFFVRAIQNIDNRLKKNIYMYSAIFVVILILYTAWYIFFFSALFLFILLIICLFFYKKNDVKSFFIKFRYDILGYIIITILLVTPFLILELPIMKIAENREYDLIKFLIGNMYSYFYVPNSIYSIIFLPLSKYFPSSEMQTGFSLVLFFIFLMSVIFLFKYNKEKLPVIYKILSISLIICLLLPIKLPFTKFSLWYFVYKFFIGGTSIRAVGRFLFYLSLPMAIITSILGNLFWNTEKIEYKKYIFSMSIICFLLFISNINVIGINSVWTKSDEVAFLNSIPNPPKNSKIFYVKNFAKDRNLTHWVMANIDAHEIAYKYNLKTINGYSGVNPQGYKIDFYDYEGLILYNWIALNNLQNDIYFYDLQNKFWSKVNFANLYLPAFDVSNKIISLCNGVWDLNPIENYSWTDENVKIFLKNKNISKNGLYLKIGTVLDKYRQQFPNKDFNGSIFVNGEKVKDLQIINGISEYFVDVKPSKDDIYIVELKTNFYFDPVYLKEGFYSRNLSLQLYYVGEKNGK